MHLPNVKQKITNQELCDIFKCSTQGGMRRSLKTKTLVLVTKTYGKQTYINYWEMIFIFNWDGINWRSNLKLSK